MKSSHHLPNNHPVFAVGNIGVLLVNLGTPDGPDRKSVKRYLKEFLSDQRVVEIPKILWQPILRGVILNTRPQKSAEAYRQVWMNEGSPLAVYTKRQSKKLDEVMEEARVDWAMRYGRPDIASKLAALKDHGCDRILIAPLYPQYSAATTASVHDAVFDVLKDMRWQPALRTLPPYHDDPVYIDALATNLKSQLAALDFKPDAVVASFHGMPQRTLELGDPYHCHCQKTARLLSEKLDLELTVSFQSRFGRAKWLEPATDTILMGMPANGVKNVAVFAPGFSCDCLETLEELAMQGKEQFEESGGQNFAYLPCLNDSAASIDMLEALLRQELAGWI